MILTKIDYDHYLEADRIALERPKMSWKIKLKYLLYPDYIWKFQRLLRKTEYYRNTKNQTVLKKIIYIFIKIKFLKLSVKLGFSIPENVFGPGLAIVHYGTIVVNPQAKVGKNCRIHADTNIGQSGGESGAPILGDNVYLAPGVKIYGRICLANNTIIAANACVNKHFDQENTMLGGIPAKIIKEGINIKQIIKHC